MCLSNPRSSTPRARPFAPRWSASAIAGVKDVRQGKFFDIEIEPGEDVETIAREVLINPVIEDYEIEYL